MLKDFVPADKGREQTSEASEDGRQKQRDALKRRRGGISVLNISSSEPGNKAGLQHVQQ